MAALRTEAQDLPEAERVYRWRRAELVRLLKHEHAAEVLAVSDADLHEIEKAHRAGCSVSLLVRIYA